MATQIANTTEQKKDPLFGTKSVRTGVSGSKTFIDNSGTRLTLSIDQVTAKALYDTLGGLLSNERGVKLDIHSGKKVTQDGSRTFESGFFFLKEIQEFGQGGVPGGETTTPRYRVKAITS